VASGPIKEQRPKIVQRALNIPYSFPDVGNASWNTNIKTLLDSNCPNGYKVLGISGWTTNSIYTMTVACYYGDSAYSLQLRHLVSNAESGTFVVYYLCIKE